MKNMNRRSGLVEMQFNVAPPSAQGPIESGVESGLITAAIVILISF